MDGKLISLQYLRAIAALLVVFHHCFSNRVAEQYDAVAKVGSWGVDIFFIISGFIIYQTLHSRRFKLGDFAARRFFRIFPLYWIALTGWIVGRLIVPDRMQGADLSVASIVQSYLLIPHEHLVLSNRIWPILIPGWTLQVELAFYLIFAVVFALCIKMRAPWLIAVLFAMAIGGAYFDFSNPIVATLTNPLLLEFMAGVFLATQLHRLHKIPAGIAVAVIVSSFGLAVMYHAELPEWYRALVMGGPALMLVGGAIALERHFRQRPCRLLERLGDSSYSLYLFHPLLLGFIAVVWIKIGLPSTFTALLLGFVPLVLVSTSIMALIVYKYLEYPMLKLSSRLFFKKH